MTKHITSQSNPSPEFVRRSTDGGLELVRLVDGGQVVIPVEITVRIEQVNENHQQVVMGIRPIISTQPSRRA